MQIELKDLIKKRETCIKSLDLTKNCSTCKYNKFKNLEPCNLCYNEILGLPINPTKFKSLHLYQDD